MLRSLRKKKIKKTVWIILAVLIVPAFVLWGSSSLVRNKEEPSSAGRISGKNISLLEYKDAIDAVKAQMIMQFGDKYSEVQRSLDMDTLAWDRLILLTEAKRQKIKVSDKEVMEVIEGSPLFQKKGIFSERIYSEMLRYVLRTQPRIFEEQTRQNIMLSKLYRKVTEDISLSDKEIAEEYRKNNQQTSVYYLAALVSDFSKNINISDDELKDYFAKNKLDFKQPLSFKIEYIFWSEEDKDAEVLRNKAEAMPGKKEDFLKTAKELGLENKETDFFGQTDPIPGIGWSPEILIMLSKVKPGELLPIIHADKNYYLIRLKERKEPYVPDFQAIKDKVKEVVVKNTAWETVKRKIESALLELNKNAGLQQAAKATGLKYGSTNQFTYGSYIEGIGMSDNFWLKAEELKEGGYSGIIKMPSGFYIIALKSKTPVDEKKFAAEKTEFAGKLLLQKKQEYFSPYFEELKNKSQKL